MSGVFRTLRYRNSHATKFCWDMWESRVNRAIFCGSETWEGGRNSFGKQARRRREGDETSDRLIMFVLLKISMQFMSWYRKGFKDKMKYRDWLKGGAQVWWTLLLLLLTTSDWPFLSCSIHATSAPHFTWAVLSLPTVPTPHTTRASTSCHTMLHGKNGLLIDVNTMESWRNLARASISQRSWLKTWHCSMWEFKAICYKDSEGDITQPMIQF